MAEEVREVLNLLNEKLSGLFPYRLELADPGELKLLEKNARYRGREERFPSFFTFSTKVWNCSAFM